MNPQPPLPPNEEPEEAPSPPPPPGSPVRWSADWHTETAQTREVRKAQERADRAVRRADRAARRVHEAQERADAQRSGARQLVDAAGDAATAALTAVSAAADEAQARLAAKARMRELEHAVVSARAGGPSDVSPPTLDEALKLADRMEPGSPGATFVRGVGFIVAGITALAMVTIGGFGWLGWFVPIIVLIATGTLADKVQAADRSRKAGRIQLELARASLARTERVRLGALPAGPQAPGSAPGGGAPPEMPVPISQRLSLVEEGDPRTRHEVVAVLDRLITSIHGLVPEADVAMVRRIRDSAAVALPSTDGPLDLTDHDTWLVRQICIDYLPRALEHFIALPSDMASEPVLGGRSARQVLDEQLTLIESRLDEMATKSYRREAGGMLNHARFVADSLRPDPFQARLAELATSETEPVSPASPGQPPEAQTPDAPAAPAAEGTRERA